MLETPFMDLNQEPQNRNIIIDRIKSKALESGKSDLYGTWIDDLMASCFLEEYRSGAALWPRT